MLGTASRFGGARELLEEGEGATEGTTVRVSLCASGCVTGVYLPCVVACISRVHRHTCLSRVCASLWVSAWRVVYVSHGRVSTRGCVWLVCERVSAPTHVPVLPFFFLSHLYTQPGAQIYNPKIER